MKKELKSVSCGFKWSPSFVARIRAEAEARGQKITTLVERAVEAAISSQAERSETRADST